MGALVVPDQRRHRVGVRGIDLRGNETILTWVSLLDRRNGSLGSREVVVGDHKTLEESLRAAIRANASPTPPEPTKTMRICATLPSAGRPAI